MGWRAIRQPIHIESLRVGIIDDKQDHLDLPGGRISQLQIEQGVSCIRIVLQGEYH